jgi:hypothetical protein
MTQSLVVGYLHVSPAKKRFKLSLVGTFPTSFQQGAPSQSVEDALQDALSHSTPAPMLIELIKAHPNHTTILDLVVLYTELVAEQPNQVDKLAEALAEVKTSKLKIGTDMDDIEPIFFRELADVLSGELSSDIDTSVAPSNSYLIASLLSAASRKHRLGESSAQVGSILCGLYYSDRNHSVAVPATYEVLVLGACLQLLSSGSYIYGPQGFHFGKIDVLSALQVAKKEGVVKNPNGQRLLEVCIKRIRLDCNVKLQCVVR